MIRPDTETAPNGIPILEALRVQREPEVLEPKAPEAVEPGNLEPEAPEDPDSSWLRSLGGDEPRPEEPQLEQKDHPWRHPRITDDPEAGEQVPPGQSSSFWQAPPP